jgi:hypothetical protein
MVPVAYISCVAQFPILLLPEHIRMAVLCGRALCEFEIVRYRKNIKKVSLYAQSLK